MGRKEESISGCHLAGFASCKLPFQAMSRPTSTSKKRKEKTMFQVSRNSSSKTTS
jgi:hypothetical protein